MIQPREKICSFKAANGLDGGVSGSDTPQPRGSPAGSISRKHVLQRTAAAAEGGGSFAAANYSDRKVSKIQMGEKMNNFLCALLRCLFNHPCFWSLSPNIALNWISGSKGIPLGDHEDQSQQPPTGALPNGAGATEISLGGGGVVGSVVSNVPSGGPSSTFTVGSVVTNGGSSGGGCGGGGGGCGGGSVTQTAAAVSAAAFTAGELGGSNSESTSTLDKMRKPSMYVKNKLQKGAR